MNVISEPDRHREVPARRQLHVDHLWRGGEHRAPQLELVRAGGGRLRVPLRPRLRLRQQHKVREQYMVER